MFYELDEIVDSLGKTKYSSCLVIKYWYSIVDYKEYVLVKRGCEECEERFKCFTSNTNIPPRTTLMSRNRFSLYNTWVIERED